MRVKNLASFPVLVRVYFDGRWGEECLVMPGEVEQAKGPLLLKVSDGPDIYFSVEDSFVVTESGRYDEKAGVLLVVRGQPSSIVRVNHGKRYGVRARHFKD
jgi:hypothetical protein